MEMCVCVLVLQCVLTLTGMDGVKNQINPPPAHEGMAYEPVPDELLLPTSLEASLQALEADTVITDALGADFIRWFRALKLDELKCQPALADCESSEDYDQRLHTWCRDIYNEFM